jgi:hypothetical protein
MATLMDALMGLAPVHDPELLDSYHRYVACLEMIFTPEQRAAYAELSSIPASYAFSTHLRRMNWPTCMPTKPRLPPRSSPTARQPWKIGASHRS